MGEAAASHGEEKLRQELAAKPLSAGKAYTLTPNITGSGLGHFIFFNRGTSPGPSYSTIPTEAGLLLQLLGQRGAVMCLPGLRYLLPMQYHHHGGAGSLQRDRKSVV